MIKKDNNLNDIQNYVANDSYDAISRGVIIISGEISELGIILAVNQQTCSIFGYRKSELIGQNIKMLMSNSYSKFHDDYLNDAVHKKEITYLRSERVLYGTDKNGFLISVSLTVKYIRDTKNFFIATVRKTNTGTLQSLLLVNDAGKIENFNSNCIYQIGLDRKSVQKNNNLDTYFPNLFNERMRFLKNLKCELGKEFVKLQKMEENMKHQKYYIEIEEIRLRDKITFFIFRIHSDKKQGIEHAIKKEVKIGNQFQINPKNHQLVVIKKPYIYSKLSQTQTVQNKTLLDQNFSSEIIDYGEGIVTLRLENGRAIEKQNDDQSQDDIQVEDKENNNNNINRQSNSLNLQNSEVIQKKEHELLCQNEGFRQSIKKKKIPDFLKFFKTGFTLIILGLAGIIFQDLIQKYYQIDYHQKKVEMYLKFSWQMTNFHNVISGVKLLMIINNTPQSVYIKDQIQDFLNESINNVEEIENDILDLGLKMNNNFFMETYIQQKLQVQTGGDYEEVSFQEALKLFLQNAFEINEIVSQNQSLDLSKMRFILDNSLDSIWLHASKIQDNMQLYMTQLEGSFYLNFIFHSLTIGLCILMGIILYFYFVKKRSFIFDVFSLFIEIPSPEIRANIKKCEIFLQALTFSEEESTFADEIKDKVEQDEDTLILKKTRKRSLADRIKLPRGLFLLLAILIFAFEFVYIYGVIMFYKKAQFISVYNKSFKILTKSNNQYMMANNSQYFSLFQPSVYIEGTTPDQFEQKIFEQLVAINGELSQQEGDLISESNENYKSFQTIIHRDTVRKAFQKYQEFDGYKIPHSLKISDFDLSLWEGMKKKHDFVNEGIFISLTKYFENMQLIASEIQNLKISKDYTSSIFYSNYCPAELTEFDYCLFNNVFFQENEIFQNEILTPIFMYWQRMFFNDFNFNFFDKIKNELLFILVLLGFVLLFCYLLIYIRFYSYQAKSLKRIE